MSTPAFRHFFCLLLILFASFAQPGQRAAYSFTGNGTTDVLTPNHFSSPPALVVDEAGLLSPKERQILEDRITLLTSQAPLAIRVAVVRDTGGLEPLDYAGRLGNQWGVGEGGSGALLLVVVPHGGKGGRTAIALNAEAEKRISPEATQAVVDTLLLPSFREGRFAEGIGRALTALSGLSDHSAGRPSYPAAPFSADVSAPKAQSGHVAGENEEMIVLLVLGGGALLLAACIVIMRAAGYREESRIVVSLLGDVLRVLFILGSGSRRGGRRPDKRFPFPDHKRGGGGFSGSRGSSEKGGGGSFSGKGADSDGIFGGGGFSGKGASSGRGGVFGGGGFSGRGGSSGGFRGGGASGSW